MTIALFALLYIAITALTVWNTTMCLRVGVITVRNGRQITRLENPILFWTGISCGFGALAMELFIGIFIAYQFWISGHR
jgi:hypothetical protein